MTWSADLVNDASTPLSAPVTCWNFTAGPRTRLLFLGPPSYVEKQPGSYLLLGIRPDAGPIVDEESLGAVVIYESHTRSVVLDPEVAEALASAGLHRLTREQWAKAPRQVAASAVVEQARERWPHHGRPARSVA